MHRIAPATRWLAGLVCFLLCGCAADPPSAPGAGPTATPATPAGWQRPPLAADLTDGVRVELAAEGHWAIAGATAFVAGEAGVEAIDLTTGEALWQAGFGSALPAWDGRPTVAVTGDTGTVLALRTVGTGEFELLRVAAADGKVIDSRLVTDPEGGWRVDLPPRILVADQTTAVLSEQPEWGRQTGVIDLETAALRWSVDEQAVAADDARVITRNTGRDRLTGRPLWQATEALGPAVAIAEGTIVVTDSAGNAPVWFDAGTGARLAAAPRAAQPADCRATDTTVVCLGDDVTAYDLATGDRLWSATGQYEALIGYRDWVYLWSGPGTGDVLAARSGEVLVTGEDLTAIVHSTAAGVLVEQDGNSWVPLPR